LAGRHQSRRQRWRDLQTSSLPSPACARSGDNGPIFRQKLSRGLAVAYAETRCQFGGRSPQNFAASREPISLSAAAFSFCNVDHASDACLARHLRRRLWIGDRWWAYPVWVLRDCVRPFRDVCGPAGKSRDHQSARCWSSYAASSPVLLIALIRRVLLDVSVAALLIEVLPSRDSLLYVEIWVRAGTFVAALLRRNGWHFGHEQFSLVKADRPPSSARRAIASKTKSRHQKTFQKGE
jgi:hypothetical protein